MFKRRDKYCSQGDRKILLMKVTLPKYLKMQTLLLKYILHYYQ